ncbi:MAG: hypothetical protein KatS3mg008_1284 [Acidimicrobiales bacterium]|nr:MAG: hypothetical protein KatS3mg008_1284 [Acidimicrobiales bacterium]
MDLSRRTFLARAAVGGGLAALAPGLALAACTSGEGREGTTRRTASATGRTATTVPADGTLTYGPLRPPDRNGLMLPDGFTSRIVAVSGEEVASTGYRWHAAPDGGACFPTDDGGWIYVSNSEVPDKGGGVSMVRFDAEGNITEARRILEGTSRNCAGGPTPWGTWLSCEEVPFGTVWECDPTGSRRARRHDAMGWFNHEAAAVDPEGRAIYLTEDVPDGLLYRFVPDDYPDLSSGILQALVEEDGVLRWVDVPEPNPEPGRTETRHQIPRGKRFASAEGAWYADGHVLFATKGDNRIWSYDLRTGDLTVEYDDDTNPNPVIRGVDNIVVAPTAPHAYVCEDGDNMEIGLIDEEGRAGAFLRLTGVDGSEMTGVSFSPDGRRLYFSSQRNPGVTYEVTGPFAGT